MKTIYYKIEFSDGLFELHSGVKTFFGGIAWNYVRHRAFAGELINWAESEGWVRYER